jgi:2-amino-4-hydroxy-6-hydroxymethyldihydropteridine diphosphokinase
MKAVIALGANLGEPSKQLKEAIKEIARFTEVISVSSFFQSEPFEVPDEQPSYTNAVLIANSELEPESLMAKLLAIESQLGRIRSHAKAARTIDIDLIDFGGLSLESETLTLPHPRAHQRLFVLKPWFEIEPGATLTGRGAVSELLVALQ